MFMMGRFQKAPTKTAPPTPARNPATLNAREDTSLLSHAFIGTVSFPHLVLTAADPGSVGANVGPVGVLVGLGLGACVGTTVVGADVVGVVVVGAIVVGVVVGADVVGDVVVGAIVVGMVVGVVVGAVVVGAIVVGAIVVGAIVVGAVVGAGVVSLLDCKNLSHIFLSSDSSSIACKWP